MEIFSEKCVILKKAFKDPFKGNERYHSTTIGNNGSDNLQCGNFLLLTNGNAKIPVVVSDVCTWNGKDDSTRIDIKVAKDERYDIPSPEMCSGDFDLCAYPITEDFILSNGLSDRMVMAYRLSLAETSAYGTYILEISLANQKLLCKTVEYVHQVQNLLSCFGIGCIVKRPFLEGSPSSCEDMRYEMVDLGLPSGLKWAAQNVGAASPEDYGDYFMWGSTSPDTYTPCDWEHCPFNNGLSDFNEKYFITNKSEWLTNEGILKPEYDAAHVNMGGSWRMPTSVEMWDLLDGTTCSFETLDGVKGMRFTSKTNGNSIFIPFTGKRLCSDVSNVGDYGYAWSSSLNTCYANDSHGIYFDDFGDAYVNDGSRCNGFVVRGVHE